MKRAAAVWRGYAVLAAVLAGVGLWHWIWAITIRGPVLYGEGAVAHAALLAREGLEYVTGASVGDVSALRPIFTAANYPPLYFHLASIGDPFVTGRLLSIAATLFVAGAIAWRARPAGRLVAATIALAWLGTVPVLQWAPAVKPDLLALAFTVGAVAALDRTRPAHTMAGALLGIAAMAKPTALLPAIALLVFIARRDPAAGARALAGGVAAAIVTSLFTQLPNENVLTHVVSWNTLPWRPELAVPLVFVAIVVLAVPLATIAVTRPSRTVVTAYAVGAAGILLLGGREGATINYVLDLSAALALAVAGRAPLLATTVRYPIAAAAAALLVFTLFNPFNVLPGVRQTTGKWGDPTRIAAVREITGTLLVEDSGLLLANGREPLVDDLFLWSRLYETSRATGRSFVEGERLLAAVREGRFDAVVSEVELERVANAPAYERQRWHPALVAAVLERYASGGVRQVYPLCKSTGPCDALYVYVRRAP